MTCKEEDSLEPDGDEIAVSPFLFFSFFSFLFLSFLFFSSPPFFLTAGSMSVDSFYVCTSHRIPFQNELPMPSFPGLPRLWQACLYVKKRPASIFFPLPCFKDCGASSWSLSGSSPSRRPHPTANQVVTIAFGSPHQDPILTA